MDVQTEAYKNALQVFVSQCNVRIDGCNETIGDLKRSLEFSQVDIDDLKNQVKLLLQEKETQTKLIAELKQELLESRETIKALTTRCNELDDLQRCNNLRIDGLPEVDAETTEQTAVAVSSMLREKLELRELPLESAHRVGPRLEGRPRPVVARFTRQLDRDAALRHGKMLRGTNIYLNEDLCPASRKMRTDQLPALKAARAQGKIAFLVNAKLIIKEKSNDRDAPRNTGTSAGLRQCTASSTIEPQAAERTVSQPDFQEKQQLPNDSESRRTTRQATRAENH